MTHRINHRVVLRSIAFADDALVSFDPWRRSWNPRSAPQSHLGSLSSLFALYRLPWTKTETAAVVNYSLEVQINFCFAPPSPYLSPVSLLSNIMMCILQFLNKKKSTGKNHFVSLFIKLEIIDNWFSKENSPSADLRMLTFSPSNLPYPAPALRVESW